MPIRTQLADYHNPEQARALISLLNAYAEDPAGGGTSLPEETRTRLTGALAEFPGAFSVLAYHEETPVGLVNCFMGFSTFAAQPLVNIHDVVVLSAFRQQGIAQQMLTHVEQVARERGCCKLTLEVLAHNQPARTAYEHFGFHGYELGPELGGALFFQKKL